METGGTAGKVCINNVQNHFKQVKYNNMNTEKSIDELLILNAQAFVEIDAAKVDFDKMIEEAKGMFDRIQAMQVKIEERIIEFKKMIEDENY